MDLNNSAEASHPKLSDTKAEEPLSGLRWIDRYFFIIWDGLHFFGFEMEKLQRLKGKKESYCDKFTNKKK